MFIIINYIKNNRTKQYHIASKKKEVVQKGVAVQKKQKPLSFGSCHKKISLGLNYLNGFERQTACKPVFLGFELFNMNEYGVIKSVEWWRCGGSNPSPKTGKTMTLHA